MSGSIGIMVRARRDALGWSQQRLADEAGLDRAHLTRLEGGRQAPRWDTIERLAAALSCAATDLFPPTTANRAPGRSARAITRRRATGRVA